MRKILFNLFIFNMIALQFTCLTLAGKITKYDDYEELIDVSTIPSLRRRTHIYVVTIGEKSANIENRRTAGNRGSQIAYVGISRNDDRDAYEKSFGEAFGKYAKLCSKNKINCNIGEMKANLLQLMCHDSDLINFQNSIALSYRVPEGLSHDIYEETHSIKKDLEDFINEKKEENVEENILSNELTNYANETHGIPENFGNDIYKLMAVSAYQ